LLNFRKSLKDLFLVNHEAGILRLFLAAALIFVLWSLLAVISSAFDPFGSMDFRNILGINSENLALSLFLDIFDAYFSIFSFSLILMFLLIVLLSLDIVADFNLRLRSLQLKNISKKYLTSCAFSFPGRKKLLFPDDRFKASEDIFDGPLKAGIKPGCALLLKSKPSYSLIYNSGENLENIEISLAFREKIIDCFNMNPASIAFFVKDQSQSRSFLVDASYDYDLPTETGNMVKYASMLALFDSNNFREIIENLLVTETNLTLHQYFRSHPESSAYPSQEMQDDPIENNDKFSKEFKQKKYSRIVNFYKKGNGHGLKRNRKRTIYSRPISEVPSLIKVQEKNLSSSVMDELNELLEINLQNTLISLFGTGCLKAKISHFQEQGSK